MEWYAIGWIGGEQCPVPIWPCGGEAVFNNYADAERAVDYLSDRHFPIEKVAARGS